MNRNELHIDELIAKYLSGNAVPDEAILLDEWRALSKDNEAYFSACAKAFQVEFTKTDTLALLNRIKQETRIDGERKVIRLSVQTMVRIAASVVFVSFLGFRVAYYVKNARVVQEELISSSGQIISRQLADGSSVVLNKNASLTITEGFNGRQRKVKLTGEAFFEVKHDDDKQFVVDAGGVEIKDIGTAFNVKANPQSDSVIVLVTEGIVDMSNGINMLRLVQNQSAVYIRSANELRVIKIVDANAVAYKTKVFRFRSATLGQVVNELNAVYGNIISLNNPALSGCTITVDFKNEPPEVMVSVIAETLGLSYQHTENTFELRGDACIQ